MHGEHVQRIVDADLVADQINRLLAPDPGNGPDDQRLNRRYKPRCRCDRGQPRNRSRDDPNKRGFAVFHLFPQRPCQRCGCGGQMGDGQRHRRATIRSQLRPTVKAKPADPQHRGADHDVAGIMWRGGFVFALPQHDRDHQRGDTCGFMNHDTTREILDPDSPENAAIRQKPAAPDPVGDRGIDQHHPQS